MLNNRTTTRSRRAENVSKECRKVLDAVADHGAPISVNTLATVVGTHPNTVRGHLDTLTDAGLISRERAPITGRGRPSWLYRPTPAANTTGNEYAGLANALAGELERASEHPREDAVEAGEHWAQELAPGAPGEGPRRQLLVLLDELGFDPDPEPVDGRVRLRNCPMIDSAARHPEVVCGVHLGLVRGILKSVGGDPDGAELLAFYEPDACHLGLGQQGS
ncbi:MAG: helix-turn-helix transcriptional regulator [Aeromicrobium sp.]